MENPKEEPKRTHYLDELPNIDKDTLVKMWEATIPRVDPKRGVFLMNAHGVIDTREPKQETTIEEAADRLYPNRDDRALKREFIFGIKWQSERMYSEEEVLKAQEAILCNIKDALMNENYIIEYLEQFKKK